MCDESFDTKEACGHHTRTTHQGAAANQNSSPEKKNTDKTHSPSKDKSKTSISEIERKRKAEQDLKPSEAKKRKRLASESELLQLSLASFSDEEILAKLLERNATFVCKCGIIFRDQALFSLHRGTHSSKNPFECSFCGYVAPNWYDFMSHFYFHSSEKKNGKAS